MSLFISPSIQQSLLEAYERGSLINHIKVFTFMVQTVQWRTQTKEITSKKKLETVIKSYKKSTDVSDKENFLKKDL